MSLDTDIERLMRIELIREGAPTMGSRGLIGRDLLFCISINAGGLTGRAIFPLIEDDYAEETGRMRWLIFERLLRDADSPWVQLPWDLALSPRPVENRIE